MAKINELNATKAVEKVQASDPLSEQLAQVETLIQAKKQVKSVKPQEASQELISYSPPVPQPPTAYQIDIEQPLPVQMQYAQVPMVSAPYPTLIAHQAPTVIAPPVQAAPRREDIIKMLLTELSRKE